MEGERGKRSPRRAALLIAGAVMLRLAGSSWGDPLPAFEPIESAPVDQLNNADPQDAVAGNLVCADSSECDDGQACTSDVCSDGFCVNIPVVDCVPCTLDYTCPSIDLVFVMDTSGSMRDEASALCTGIAQVNFNLTLRGIDVWSSFLGVTQTPGGSFSCLTHHVLGLLGGTVPGDGAGCPFPDGTSPYESWGPATAIVAERFPWTPGATRIIVPISDEGPCDGSLPEGCNDPGDDRASTDNATAVAIANQVIVSPIVGSGVDTCTLNLANLISLGTGGMVVQSKNPQLDLTDAIWRIIVDRCIIDDICDDQSVCTTDDRCRDEVCMGTLIPGCQSCETDADCNDENPCTIDWCVANRCSSSPAYDVSTECCDPVSGSISQVGDGDPCTLDECDPATGRINHLPAPMGTPCDDGSICTFEDVCDAAGVCSGTDANSVPCSSDADCFGIPCMTDVGRCRCDTKPELNLIAVLDGACHTFGDELIVDVELGFSIATVRGGQFLIEYDPAVLDFVSIESGAAADPASPFSLQLAFEADESTGRVFYAVVVLFEHPGSQGPAIMARLHFRKLAKCLNTDICFIDDNPRLTRLVSPLGTSVPHNRNCTGDLYIAGDGPVLTCPDNFSQNASAGSLFAEVGWDPILATSECDGTLQIQCHGVDESGIRFEHLIPTGGQFPIGHFEFECTATNSCSASGSCQWSVDVPSTNSVEVDVQLSAVMTPHLISRCIEFAFYQDCTEEPVVVEQTVDFGGFYNFPGSAHNLTLKVPQGKYGCVTARDPRHTLRAVALPEIIDGKYVIEFTGDPTFDGNWLVNGNLNGDHVIDLLDHNLLLAQYAANLNPSTPCGTGSELHSDLNGNGTVDSADLGFIQRNYLADDKGACCPTSTSGADPSGPSEISLEELDALGLSDLRAADADGDGMVNAEEIMSFLHLQGGNPADDAAP